MSELSPLIKQQLLRSLPRLPANVAAEVADDIASVVALHPRLAQREIPKTCTRCHNPMRPGKTTEASHPGTKEHHGRGLCIGCYQVSRRVRGSDIRALAEDAGRVGA